MMKFQLWCSGFLASLDSQLRRSRFFIVDEPSATEMWNAIERLEAPISTFELAVHLPRSKTSRRVSGTQKLSPTRPDSTRRRITGALRWSVLLEQSKKNDERCEEWFSFYLPMPHSFGFPSHTWLDRREGKYRFLRNRTDVYPRLIIFEKANNKALAN